MVNTYQSKVVRDAPRVSLNKLAEYSVASPTRRKRIVADQKRPSSYIVPRYQAAELAIVSSIRNGLDAKLIARAIDDLKARPAATEGAAQRTAACVAALQAFARLDKSALEGYTATKPSAAPAIRIGGVDLSVHPNAVLADANAKKGLLKLYLSKTYPLNEDSARFVTSTLHHYAFESIELKGAAAELATVIDVFAGRTYFGVGAQLLPMKKIIETCRMLRGAWDEA